ncbi:FecR domain-containing protein [uncultured Bacteroides sp.]|uniref:FecR family protein n=1 Tax=uncultured Bacteroides sp. TaxID=162156 RepID=UPI0025F5F119|nr:FecR domain-containing protein [uncultured Bacteroides sp.]
MDRDLLYRFFEGDVSVEEMKLVKEWAEASEENGKLLRRERKLFNAMILAGHVEPADRSTISYKKKNYFIREFLKIASAVLITVGITATLFSIGKDTDDVNVAMQTITVPAGQRVNLDLPDGTNVWLNAGTKMQYPVSFMKDKREVILDGEAYFEVVHNAKSPFIVRTHAMDVEVLGTKFNVEAYSKRNIFEASLMQGRVKVKSPNNEKMAVVLLPHYKTTLIDRRLVVSNIDDYNVYRWKEGLYCFKNKPFARIMEDLEKYYDLKIQLDKKSIANVILTGKFRISDGLDYALRVLRKDVAFTYRRDKNNDVIYIK